MMRKVTAEKIAQFLKDYAIGTELDSYKMYHMDAKKYPCWQTLKKYGVVKYIRSEYYDYNDESGVVIEVRVYKVEG